MQSALELQLLPHSGTRFHPSVRHEGIHQHYFHAPNPPTATGTQTMPTGPGTFAANDMLFVWVYLDSTELPTEVMVQFYDENASWEHRAFWGADQIAWGTPGTGAHKKMCAQGDLCGLATNTWQKLSVSAGDVGLTGHRVTGVAFTLFGGKAYWDDVGYNQTTWVDDETPRGAVLVQYWDGGWFWANNKRNWLQFGGDPSHAGNNPLDMQISPATMKALLPLQGFTPLADDASTAPPVLLKNVLMVGVVRDVIFWNLKGILTARDGYTNEVLCNYPAPPVGSNDIKGLGSPAIDPSLQYVYNVGRDYKVHKYDIFNCSEVGTGWVLPAQENYCKTSITVATVGTTTYLYVGTASSAGGDFGHVVTIDASSAPGMAAPTPLQTTAGMWQSGGLPFDSASQRIIAATGENTGLGWDPPTGRWPISILGVRYSGAVVEDSYTPTLTLWASLNSKDLDLSSTNTLLLPNNGTYTSFQRLAAQTGKDGYVRLVELANMNGTGMPGFRVTTDVPAVRLPTLAYLPACDSSTPYCYVKVPIASWLNPADRKYWVFVNSPTGMNAFRLDESGSTPSLTPVWNTPAPTVAPQNLNVGGAFVANGVLYYGNTGGLQVVDATTGLNASGTIPGGGSQPNQYRQTPVVINGVVYYKGAAYTLGGLSPFLYNLALRRPAFQSSNILSYPTTGGLANDGNTDGNFWNASVIHTNNGPLLTPIPNLMGNQGQIWSVDLGGLFTVSKVVIFNRTDGGQSRLSNFRIVAQNNTNPPASQFIEVHSHPGAASDPVIVASFSPTLATTIIVQAMCATSACGTDDDYLNFAEVQVF